MTPTGQPPAFLVVDDDPVSREMLMFMLGAADLSVLGAADGQEAVELIQNRGPAVFEAVFTDVQMPRMGGLALLEWLNTHSPSTATVIMTGNQERALVSASLRGGAVEFLDKPFEKAALLRAIQQARATFRSRRERLAAAHRLLDIAGINQRLTRSTPLGLSGAHAGRCRLTTRFYAIDEAGGDLIKAAALDDDRILLVLGDVSGHGLKEGFLSAYFQGIIEGMASRATTGRDIAEAFNRFLIEQWNDAEPLAVSTSLSACFLEIDFLRLRLSILNCGSPGVLLADTRGETTLLAPGGSPLGWFPSIEPVELTLPIAPGGRLWLWSDGLEAHAETLRIPPLALATRILQAPEHSLAGDLLQNADDDIVACRLDWSPPPTHTPPPEPICHLISDKPSDPFDFQTNKIGDFAPADALQLTVPFHHVTYPGDAAPRIDSLQADWHRLLSAGLPRLGSAGQHDTLLCLREAVLNALHHGCSGDPARTVRLSLLLDEPARRLLARVTDDGPGFDPATAGVAHEDHISLGLRLIRSLASETRFSPDGRTLEMVFPAAPPS